MQRELSIFLNNSYKILTSNNDVLLFNQKLTDKPISQTFEAHQTFWRQYEYR